LEKYLRENTVSLFIINDPCNPTGVKFTRQEIIEIAQVFMKPEFSNILIVLDDVYYELIYSNEKTFLQVIEEEGWLSSFKPRLLIFFSMSKIIAGNPGLRFGYIYSPDMEINGTIQEIGDKFGVMMADQTTAVSNIVEYIGIQLVKAKVGRGNAEWVKLQKNWDKNTFNTYKNNVQLGISLFNSPQSHLPFVTPPTGAFFGLISGKKLIGKKVPNSIKLADGKIIDDIPTKILTTKFETDIHIAYYFLHVGDVVTVPASGCAMDPSLGYIRVSFTNTEANLKLAFERLNYITEVILKYNQS
jgi:aspartate/methionine/tyrosine aminotransferase